MTKNKTCEQLEKKVKELEEEAAKCRQVGQSRRESEKKYKDLAESLTALVYRADPKTFAATYVNKAVESFYGYTQKEWLKDPSLWESSIHPDDNERTLAEFTEAQSKIENRVIEYRITRKDKEIRWVEDHLSWEIDQQTNAVSMNGVMYDVTTRKKAEEALRRTHENLERQVKVRTAELVITNRDLEQRIKERDQALEAMRESEKRYKAILESIEDGYYEVDVAGNFIFINDSMSKIYGYSKDEFIGMSYRKHMDQENAKRTYGAFNRVYRTGQALKGFEHEITRKDGHKKHLEISVSAIKDSNGRPAGFRGIMRDITARKRAEQALKREQERFRILVEESPLGVLLVGKDGEYQYLNPKFVQMFGYTLEDIPTGREWFRKAYPNKKYRRQVISSWLNDQKEFKDAEARVRVYTVKCKDGSEKVVGFRPVTMGSGDQFVICEDITERKRAEEALRESVDRFGALAENAPFGISIMTSDRRFEYFNKEFTRLFGYTIKDIPDKETWFENAYPDEQYRKTVASTWKGDFVGGSKTGEIRRRVFKVRCKNGQEKIISFRPVDLKDGKQFLTYQDITEKARAEEELQQSEKRYRVLVEESFDGIFIQKGTEIIFANQRFHEMLGYNHGELLGLDHWLMYHPDDQQLTRSRAQARMRGETVPSQYEVRLQRKDGSWFYGELSARDVNIEGGPGVQVWVKDISERKLAEETLRDAHEKLEKRVQERTADLAKTNEELSAEITQRKRVEEALRESELRFRSLVETSSDWVWEVDYNTVYTYASPKVKDLLGYEPEEVIGKTPFDLMPADERVHVAELFGDIAESRKPFVELENTNLHKDGRQVVLETSGVPVLDASGNLLGYRGIDRNITQRKRVEVELQKSKEAAVTANRTKSEFLANMSHELRTPLNHIIGFTELVVGKNSGDLNETQAEYLNDVLQSGKHLLSLINDILDLSKVEAGKHELEMVDVNPRVLLENSLVMVKEKAMKHRIKIATDVDDIPETIRADERKLKQIMYNLLSNAVKFTPDREEVHSSARMVDCIVRPGLRKGDPEELKIIEGGVDSAKVHGTKSRKCIEFSVSDTGIGIRAEDQQRIFNPFEQVDSSAGRRYQGTGLGLSLTKKLVEMHGGNIWVESEGEGKGSTFRFIIPV
jgi:PAS domain S-box-containing protein